MDLLLDFDGTAVTLTYSVSRDGEVSVLGVEYRLSDGSLEPLAYDLLLDAYAESLGCPEWASVRVEEHLFRRIGRDADDETLSAKDVK